MFDIEKLDDELYKTTYILRDTFKYNEIWSKIKNNPEILRSAVEIKKDKFNIKDIVNGLTICDRMLIDYNSVDKVAYNNLINSIYSNTDIARIVVDGASNGGFSFLLMSLWNHNLKLTEEQKAFAVNEAMNKIGTTRWEQTQTNLDKKLDELGINDENTTFIDIDGCVNPIGEKSGFKYMNNLFNSFSDTQAHGDGEFDIRYHILKNPNWSIEEKQKLVMDFWCDDETYEEYLEQWEWGIVNDKANYKGEIISQFDRDLLYDYSYDDLLDFYWHKKTTDRIWSEIEFCRLMHKLRPQRWEIEYNLKKRTLSQF